MTRFKNILVPTDFSEPSLHALDVAIDLAQTFGAKLTLIHTYEIPVYPEMSFTAPDLMAGIEKAAQAELDKTLAHARERIPEATAILHHGVAWRDILAAIERTHADLVVMGTHGRRGVERALLGSVAEKIVRLSPVAVLTVRHEKR